MIRLDALPFVDDQAEDDEALGNVASWPSLPVLRRDAARAAGRPWRLADVVPTSLDRLRRPPVDVSRIGSGVMTVPRGALLCDRCSEPYAERPGVLSLLCPPCRLGTRRLS